VSPMVVRSAVSALAQGGAVDVRHGSGIYVKAVEPLSPGAAIVSLMYLFNGDQLTTIQRDLLDRGFLLCVYSQGTHHWDPEAERKFFDRIRRERHRALLAFCSPLAPRQDDAALTACERAGVRVIHVEHYRTALPGQEYILPDYRESGRMAARDLLRAGYPDIMLIQSNPKAPFSRLFAEGVGEILSETKNGYNAQRDRLQVGPAFQDDPAVRKILADRVRAAGGMGFACDHAGIAMNVRDTLAQAGLKTPGTVGVIGPALIPTNGETLRVDRFEFDRDAILRRAVEAATGPRGEPLRVLMPPKLVRQGSVRV
jgi:DNA-binding LacI/PurR family transcriptional regulator